MTRRALFAALALLPFVGRLTKKAAPVVDGDWEVHGNWSAATWAPNGTMTQRNLNGSRVVATFVRDDDTGGWYEYGRTTRL